MGAFYTDITSGYQDSLTDAQADFTWLAYRSEQVQEVLFILVTNTTRCPYSEGKVLITEPTSPVSNKC